MSAGALTDMARALLIIPMDGCSGYISYIYSWLACLYGLSTAAAIAAIAAAATASPATTTAGP